MKYEQPYGVSDPNAPYINGNPAAGIAGSIPPAAAFEYPQRELIAMIMAGGLTPSDSDLQQLLRAVRSQLPNYCIDSGTVNHLVTALNPPLIGYSVGMPFRIRIAHTNTGAADFNAGPGAHPIKRVDGSDPAASDLPGGGLVELLFDGTNFQMTNYFGRSVSGGSTTTTVLIPYIADTSTTANSIVAPFLPAITALTPGMPIEVKVANTVTGATQIYVNALPPLPVVNRWGGPLRSLDLCVGEITLMLYHPAGYWQLAGQQPRPAQLIYQTPGTFTWTCPVGVYTVDAEVWGGGAGGFNYTSGPIAGVSPGGTDGAGGSSGGYSQGRLAVTPGNNYTVTVGAGGAGTTALAGYNGQASGFASLSATGGSWSAWVSTPGQGSGGDINIPGGMGFLVTSATGAVSQFGGLGWYGTYGFGGNAPRGGSGGQPYSAGFWPGGGGGGGDFYGPAGSAGSGPGGNGGVILRF
jgi:hypothetical protein